MNPNKVKAVQSSEELHLPEYMYAEEASVYLRTTSRKLGLYRKYKLLKCGKLGKNYVYKKDWLDQFMEEWSGYDLSNEEAVKQSIRSKEWRENHA